MVSITCIVSSGLVCHNMTKLYLLNRWRLITQASPLINTVLSCIGFYFLESFPPHLYLLFLCLVTPTLGDIGFALPIVYYFLSLPPQAIFLFLPFLHAIVLNVYWVIIMLLLESLVLKTQKVYLVLDNLLIQDKVPIPQYLQEDKVIHIGYSDLVSSCLNISKFENSLLLIWQVRSVQIELIRLNS